MKKIGILVGSVAIGTALGTVGALVYSWQQVTQLPGWYGQTGTILSAEAMTAGQVLENKLLSGQDVRYVDHSRVEIALDETELNQVVMDAIASSPHPDLWQATRGVHTNIESDRVESGMVVNLKHLPLDQLPGRERQVVDRVVSTFPMLADRDIYVGIEGQPRIENGQVMLDENTRIRIGNLSLTVPELAKRLGVSSEQLAQQINLTLPLGYLTLDGLEFTGDRAILRGAVE